MEEYKNSGYYQSLGIDELQKQLAGYQTDDATLRGQAESQYRPTYDAEVEAIRQQLAAQTQGYNSQIAGLGAAYDQQRRKTNQAYNESAVSLNNALTKRGLGRSSLVSTQGAYLENQRNQALNDISSSETAAINSINEKIALLTDQAAQSERTLAGNYARQLENRVGELKEQNRSASISLQLQIAALQQQGYEAYQNWLLDQSKQELERQQNQHQQEMDKLKQELDERKHQLNEQEFRAEHPELFEENAGGGAGSSGSGGARSTTTVKKAAADGRVGGALSALLKPVKQALTGQKTSAAQQTAVKKTTAAKTGKKSAAKTGKQRVGAR